MASRWDLQNHYDRVVDFLDGRDIFSIPKEEVWGFIGMKETKKSFPTQAAMRLATMFELHRMRTDSNYRRKFRPPDDVRTLRNLWYQVIKPFLNRIERPADILQDKWGRQRSQVMSAVLSEMVLSGVCRYKEFHIEDRTRPSARPSRWNKLNVGRFDEVVVFIEKDTQFTTLEGMAELLGFTVECGKGQQATTAIEELVEHLDQSKSYLFFTVTDHDYYGHLIASSMEERIGALGIDAEFHRFGVNPDQVPDERIDVDKFLIPMKSQAEQDWAYAYAIDGKYGLEIEALSGPELRKALSDAVYEHCDPEELYAFLKENALSGLDDEVASEVLRQLADKDEEIKDLLEQIEKLREEMDVIKDKIREKIRPVVREVVEDKLEELDEREDFPYEWLEEQIVEGQTYLDHSEFTDTDEMKDGLVELVVGEMELID